jgi:hypothetical protein
MQVLRDTDSEYFCMIELLNILDLKLRVVGIHRKVFRHGMRRLLPTHRLIERRHLLQYVVSSNFFYVTILNVLLLGLAPTATCSS